MMPDRSSAQRVVTMKRMSQVFRSWRLMQWLAVSLLLCACKADDVPARGQLMVVLQTDMSLPKDVTQVKIVVKVGDKPYHDKNYIIAPGENWVAKLPATLAVVASVDNPTPVVDVQVVGLRQREARVFAHAITTIPERRIATLYVPIQWLCEGSAIDLGSAGYASTCEPKDGEPRACRAGTCEEVEVAERDLDDYEEDNVFGGADLDSEAGLCFDTVRCFDAGFAVTPDEDCVVEVEVPDGYALNLGLLNPDNGDGICTEDEDRCYVPLDRNSMFGWTYARGSNRDSKPVRAQLPEAVCEKLDEDAIEAVQATLACDTKTLQYPTCGPWSSVDKAFSPGDVPTPPLNETRDAGTDAAPEAGPLTNFTITYVDQQLAEIGIPVALQLNAESDDGEALDLTSEAQWGSSDEDVATVEDGVVTGHSAGEVTVSADYMGEVTTFELVVERGTPVSLVITGPDEPVPAGRTMNLVATATYVNDSTEDVTELAEWSVDDESVATVEDGVVTGITVGQVAVHASFNGTESDPVAVEVDVPELTGIRIVNLGTGGTNSVQLGVVGQFSDDSEADISDQATWEQTAGETFGTLDVATGLVTGVEVGVVQVRATVGAFSRTVDINVTAPEEVDGGT